MDKIKENIRIRKKLQNFFLLIGAFLLLVVSFFSLQEEDNLHLGKAIIPDTLESGWEEEHTLYLPGTLGRINVNMADQETLEALPGVGEKLAKRIIEYREEKGSFQKIEDIVNVSGIGLKKLEQMKEYIIAE